MDTRLVSDAVAELAYRMYQERLAKGWYKTKTIVQGWSYLSNSEQLRLIKAAHQTLDMLEPSARMELIREYAEAWRVRPRNQRRENGSYPTDDQRWNGNGFVKADDSDGS